MIALIYLGKNLVKKAANQLKFILKSTEDVPNLDQSLVLMGHCFFLNKYYEKALKYYNKAVKLNPDNTQAQTGCDNCKRKINKHRLKDTN